VLKVVFDSSFLIAVAEHPTTWFEDMVDALGKVEPVALDCVRKELEDLSSREGGRSRFAAVALDLARKFTTAPCGEASVDDEIVSAALSAGAAVATTDRDLIRTLRSSHVRVATLAGGRVSLV
jgi:rRNA-processing protein FCF1